MAEDDFRVAATAAAVEVDVGETNVGDGAIAQLRKSFVDPEVHAEYCEEIAKFCTSHQVPYTRADVSVPFDELILRVFRRGGFLR